MHQFDDLEAAAGELRRVLGPGSQVLVRGFLADVAVTGVFSAFPGIERSAAAFPSTDVVTASFVAGGFEVERVVDVVEPWRFDVESWERLVSSVRATDSLLRRLTDEEVDAGVRSVIATTTADGTVQSDVTLRLVVFRAC